MKLANGGAAGNPVPGGGDGGIGENLAAFIRGQILQRNYRAQNEVPGRLLSSFSRTLPPAGHSRPPCTVEGFGRGNAPAAGPNE